MDDERKKFADYPASSPVGKLLASGTLGFDPDALRAKYAEERDKRVRKEAEGQYQELTGAFAELDVDPFVEPGFTREAVEKEVDVAIIGGGFGGLMAGASLRKIGVEDICCIDKGGDFGGTWYWNRYPGAQCDVEGYVYLPLLDEMGYIPKEKYSHGPEILEHSKAIARHFDLYKDALFQTEVSEMRWDEPTQRWHISTNRGDLIKARFVPMATGPFCKAKLPKVDGIEKFKGHIFHTARWDYDYTGGDSNGNMTGLKDKRVGIVGTGPTALQCISFLGESSKELYVFQRTPSSIDVRNNRPTDPEWAKSLKPGWAQERLENFTSITSGGFEEEDMVGDGWTDAFRILAGTFNHDEWKDLSDEDRTLMLEIADFQKMEEIRARVNTIVKDEKTAENLKAYYRQFCKRPCFHDEYLDSYNLPNVTLVDTNGQGVDKMSEKGVIVDGKEYELDCLIIATGFDNVSSFTTLSGYDIIGREGVKLSEKWANGPSTLHGMTSHSFPNCFFMGLFQTGLTISIPYTLREQADHIAYVVDHCMNSNVSAAETTQEAEDEWVAEIRRLAHNNEDFFAQCTPGYYNNEGKSGKNGNNIFTDQYGGGAPEFFDVIEEWRKEGTLKGMDLS